MPKHVNEIGLGQMTISMGYRRGFRYYEHTDIGRKGTTT